MFFLFILAFQDGISLRKPTEKAELFNNACQTSTTQTTTITTAGINKKLGSFKRVCLKYQNHWSSFPWERLKTVKWMNERATKPGVAYMPTDVRDF